MTPTRSDADMVQRTGDAETPPKFQEVVSRDTALRTQEDQVSRNMDRANPTRGPSAARSIFLVIEGGLGDGPAWVEGGRAPGRLAQASSRGRADASNSLKLVVG